MQPSPNSQTILFDLDDTLIHCNKYYEQVLKQFEELVVSWFCSHHPLTVEEVGRKQFELDVEWISHHGFVPDHFPISLVDTYRYFSDLLSRSCSAREEQQLLALGRSVFEHQIEPYPCMIETLDALQADGHILHLYTGGVFDHQHRKVQSLQLEQYFDDRIFVRQHKTAEALESIVHTEGFDRARTWMIGNSLRTDVVPALRAGINCIYIPALNEWSYNMVDILDEPQRHFFQLQSLEEVPAAIAQSTGAS